MVSATGLKKIASKLSSTLKNPAVTGTAGAGAGLLASQIINAGADVPDNIVVINPNSGDSTPQNPGTQTDDSSLANIAALWYMMNQSNGGGGGNNSEPEKTADNGFNLVEYLPWVAGLAGVGLIVYLLFDKKKGRR